MNFERGLCEYRWESDFPRASRHLVESMLSGIRVFADWLIGKRLPAITVYFRHDCDADPCEYERVFGVRPVFGADFDGARFEASVLDTRIPHADRTLQPLLERRAQELPDAKEEPLIAFEREVRRVIESGLEQHQGDLDRVASALSLSARTLQRKLNEIGTGFQVLLDDIRFSLAKCYLQASDMRLFDIPARLGYREQSSFSHAFRQWSGASPAVWRRLSQNSFKREEGESK